MDGDTAVCARPRSLTSSFEPLVHSTSHFRSLVAPISPAAVGLIRSMLGDDEDVFDSVTWESPTVTYEGPSTAVSGPGFRQSTSESEDGRSPHDPKWEGYLITTVKDPVKELAETKDAYVSYLVSAKVGVCAIYSTATSNLAHVRRTFPYSPPPHPPLAGDSRTLSSCALTSRRISLHALCLPFRISTDLVRPIARDRFPISSLSGTEYVTGDRFSPEFMERRRAEYVSVLY